MTKRICLIGLAAGLLAMLPPTQARVQDAGSGATPAGETLQLPLPQPFPLPYGHLALAPRDDTEAAYFNFLRTTRIFPDQALCTRELERRLDGKARPDSLKVDWVTPPFLAWGGKLGGHAIVGPIRHLYAITEAHVTVEMLDGKTSLLTFACFARYPGIKEAAIWRAGHVAYGAYISPGHGKYTSGPAHLFAHAPSGTASAWDPDIRYLHP